MLGRLLHRIDTSGPVPFDEFMEMCLYDPDEGYFTSGGVRPGVSGDFVTSPEVSPWFGRLIGRWIGIVAPEDWPIVEIGGGSGSLLAGVADELPGRPLWAVERSPSAREAIAAAVPAASIARDLDAVDSASAVIVMNEVLDNIPCALVRRTDDGWVELAVDRSSDGLRVVGVPPRDQVVLWADQYLPETPACGVGSVQLGAGQVVRDILEQFDGVAVCAIDYGGQASDLARLPKEAVVRTYRGQRTWLDYLTEPGSTDITVDVNTDALVAAAESGGAEAVVVSQAAFLRDLGAADVVGRLRDAERTAASAGDVMSQLRARSDALGLDALMGDHGLGAFRVVTIMREPCKAR